MFSSNGDAVAAVGDTGCAVQTTFLSTSCTSISLAVFFASNFNMPDIVLEYRDAGNNLFPVHRKDTPINYQQVFLDTTLRPSSTCRIPFSFELFFSNPNVISSGRTQSITSNHGFPVFEGSCRLVQLSRHLDANRLIAGSRFPITVNGETFRFGSQSISNVENNVLFLHIVHGSTSILSVVDDDWDTRVSTRNVSPGKLNVNAFDSSCTTNTKHESFALSISLFYGDQNSCNKCQASLPFFGHNLLARFVSGEFNTSSLYLLIFNPESGPNYFCICTEFQCARKSFQVVPGAPADLVLVNVSFASSFDASGTGLNCNPTFNRERCSDAYIEFAASAFDVNEKRVLFSNYSFTALVRPVSSDVPLSVILWEY